MSNGPAGMRQRPCPKQSRTCAQVGGGSYARDLKEAVDDLGRWGLPKCFEIIRKFLAKPNEATEEKWVTRGWIS